MGIIDQYSRARVSSNLKGRDDGETADVDVIGAAGLAGKESFGGRPGTPLGMALLRLFVGDDHHAEELARVLAAAAWDHSFAVSIKIQRSESVDIAKAVLAWHRNGTCLPCHGLGYKVIGEESGRRAVTDQACPRCRGTGKLLFERMFPARLLPIAQWLLAEIQREQSKAGPAAMAALASGFDL